MATCPRILKASGHAWRVAPGRATQRASRSKAHRAKEAQIRAVFKRCKPEPQCQQSVPPTLPHLRATQRASISKAHKAREAQIRAVFKRCKPEPQTHLPQNSQGKLSCMASCPWGATQRASRSKAHKAREAQIRTVFKRCKP